MDEGPPPNEDDFEDVGDDEEEDADANEDAPPRLLERIANNDPDLVTLDLNTFFDLGFPKVDEEDGALDLDWWGEGSIIYLDGDAQFMELLDRLCERHVDEAIEAFKSGNTHIKHVRIDAFFRYELRNSGLPWAKSLALLQALYQLPNLESFEMDDADACCLSEFIDVLSNKAVQRLKIGHLNVEGSDRISILADKLRGHLALKDISFDMDFEISTKNEHLLEQTYIVDPLFDAFATIPNLDRLSLSCTPRYATSLAEPLQNLLRHPKLSTLSLRGLLPKNRSLCQTVAETLAKDKANLDFVDLSFSYPSIGLGSRRRWENQPSLWLTQEMAEMLFSLVEKHPSLKVKVSCYFSFREIKSIVLNAASDVEWYLQKAEVMRGVRLEKAGMRALLVSKDGSTKAAWVDMLTRVKDDAQALFHVVKEHPSICDETKSGDEKITNELARTQTPGNSRYQAEPKLKKRKLRKFGHEVEEAKIWKLIK